MIVILSIYNYGPIHLHKNTLDSIQGTRCSVHGHVLAIV